MFNSGVVKLSGSELVYDYSDGSIRIRGSHKTQDLFNGDKRKDFEIVFNPSDSKYGELLSLFVDGSEYTQPAEQVKLSSAVDNSLANPMRIPLGLGVDGNVFNLCLDKDPHLFVIGSAASGKTSLFRNIVAHAVQLKSEVDAKILGRSEWIDKHLSADLAGAYNVSWSDVYDPEATIQFVEDAERELKFRYDSLGTYPVDKLKPMYILVEDLTDLGLLIRISQVAVQGSGVNMFLMLSSQRFMEPIRFHFGTTLMLGMSSSNMNKKLFFEELTELYSFLDYDWDEAGKGAVLTYSDGVYRGVTIFSNN